jgi:glycosyltransferase involved in cell wall biosynthesis
MNIVYFANPCSPHDCKWINLLSNNHEVIIISQDSLEDTVYANPQITVHQILPPFQILKQKRSDTLQKIEEIFISFKPDLIHSMYLIPNSFWADESKKNIPHIITTRGSDVLVEYPSNYLGIDSIKKSFINILFNKKVRSALSQASAITCTSSSQLKVISDLTKVKSTVIPTGIDIKGIDALKENREKSEVFEVFCPRYLKPIYNLEKIIGAFQMFQNKWPNSRLTLIEEKSSYGDELKSMVSSLKLEHTIRFIKKMNLDNLIATYNQSDLVIMIPESDGTPNTALEAIATETPLILGAANYDNELFSTEYCWRLKSNKSETLFKAMQEVKQMNPDELSVKLNQAKRNISEKTDLTNSVSKVEQIYQSLI